MRKKRLLSAVVLATSATIALSACSDGSTVGTAPEAQAPASQAADATSSDGAFNLLSGTARSNGAQADTGDWAMKNGGVPDVKTQPIANKWVQLTASSAGDLDPVVVNGARLTLYRFDKDVANSGKSACNADDGCAAKWPPVTIQPNGKVFLAGLKKKDIGFIRREDGQIQITNHGWPMYRFAQDSKPGDTKGQGVGGTWFGIRPDGGKALANNNGGDNGIDNGSQGGAVGNDGGQAEAATSAILFGDVNFGEGGASQGVSLDSDKDGCINVTTPGVTSSVAAQGSLKLWSKVDCTGESVTIDGDTRDLSRINAGGKIVNFDDKVFSVKLGG